MNSGCAQHVGERHDGGVEALEMADLEDPAAGPGERDQGVGLVERGGDRLFDQDVQPDLEQAAGDDEMLPGRHRDARGLDPARQEGDVAQRLGAEPRSEFCRALGHDVDHGDQLGLVERGILLGMIAAEMAAADDRGASGLIDGAASRRGVFGLATAASRKRGAALNLPPAPKPRQGPDGLDQADCAISSPASSSSTIAAITLVSW